MYRPRTLPSVRLRRPRRGRPRRPRRPPAGQLLQLNSAAAARAAGRLAARVPILLGGATTRLYEYVLAPSAGRVAGAFVQAARAARLRQRRRWRRGRRQIYFIDLLYPWSTTRITIASFSVDRVIAIATGEALILCLQTKHVEVICNCKCLAQIHGRSHVSALNPKERPHIQESG